MREAMGNAVGSAEIIFEFKVPIAIHAEGATTVNSCFSNGSTQDISSFEVLIRKTT
jgi:hypothetical protein